MVSCDLDYLPETHSHVFATRSKASLLMRVPIQAKTLSSMADQLDLGIDLAMRRRLQSMLRPVKDEDLAIYAERRDDVWVLWLVASFVHLARVLNLVNNVTLDGSDLPFAVAPNLSALIIIVIGIGSRRLGNLHVRNLQVVGAVI